MGSWIVKDSGTGTIHYLCYKSYLVGSVESFSVELPNLYDNAYNDLTPFSYDNKNIYPLEIRKNPDGKKEVLNAIGLQFSRGASASVQVYVDSHSEEEPLGGRTLLSTPITYEEEYEGFEKFTLPQTETLQQGDTVYIAVTGDIPYAVSAYTKNSSEFSRNTIAMDSSILLLDGTQDENVGASVLYPDGNSALTYTSMNPDIVTVDSNGSVTAVSSGDTLIKVDSSNDTKYRRVHVRMSLDLATAAMPSITYNGRLQTPVPSVSVNGILLTRDTDYTYDSRSYTENRNAGTGTLTLTGMGNYHGTKIVSFPIQKRNLADTSIQNSTLTYHPDNSYPLTQGTEGNSILALTADGDTYALTAQDITARLLNNHTGTQTFHVTGKGNFTGTRDFTVTVAPYPVTGLSVTLSDNTAIRYDSLRNDTYRYTGEEVCPEVTVTGTVCGRSRIFDASEYTLTYANNTEPYVDGNLSYAGKTSPSVTAVLNGNYQGSSSVRFNIRGAAPITPETPSSYSLMDAEWSDSSYEIPFSPSGHTFHPTISMNDGRILTEGRDYEVTVESPALLYQLGDVWVYAGGTGEYTDVCGHSYTITPRDVADVAITVSDAVYGETPVTPSVHMVLDGQELTDDFLQANCTLTYLENNAVGQGKVRVSGHSLMKGTREITFSISGNSTVSDPVPPTEPAEPEEPENSNTDITMVKGEKCDRSIAGATYVSKDKRIASVNRKGIITAIKTGQTDILITTAGKTTTLTVTVETPSVKNKKVALTKGHTTTLSLNGTTLDPSWNSSRPSVAEVTENGTVTAMGRGTAKLTALVHGKKFTVTVQVTEPKLSVTDAYIRQSKSLSLKLTGAKQDITWNSEDPATAVVNEKGKVTALALGETYVIAESGGETYRCRITVIPNETPVVVPKTLYLTKGVSGQISMKNSSMRPVWSSMNPSVATVSEDGTVSGIGAGKTKATGILYGKKISVNIVIEAPYLSKTGMTVTAGKPAKLQLKGTKQAVTWTSSTPDVAIVTKGKVTPLANGTAVITATTADGVAYPCTVTVEGF